MSVKATPFQRKLIVYILLALALAGGAIRLWAPNPSALRDIGSLLLVLWLPVIGNVVGFFGRKIRLPAPKLAFDAGVAFTPQLRIAFMPVVPQPPRAPAQDGLAELFTLVIGREGFNARPGGPIAAYLDAGGTQEIELEFLHPARALHRFPVGTEFKLLVDTAAVGRGTVLACLAGTGSSS
ncbi:MAG: hypothetical protein EOO54_06390 [Haliea sp.]|nr:MAG: hypothetical protein EOO54_06390 [Haliea sp.]